MRVKRDERNDLLMLAGLVITVAVFLAQRLTRIDDTTRSLVTEVKGMGEHVGRQNHRVDKLEAWQQRVGVFVGIVVFCAPFVFWALNARIGG